MKYIELFSVICQDILDNFSLNYLLSRALADSYIKGSDIWRVSKARLRDLHNLYYCNIRSSHTFTIIKLQFTYYYFNYGKNRTKWHTRAS